MGEEPVDLTTENENSAEAYMSTDEGEDVGVHAGATPAGAAAATASDGKTAAPSSGTEGAAARDDKAPKPRRG